MGLQLVIVIKFKPVYFQFTQEAMNLPDAVMAFLPLSSCNLLDQQFQLVMSTILKVTYAHMKSNLKREFGREIRITSTSSLCIAGVKIDPVLCSAGQSMNAFCWSYSLSYSQSYSRC